MTLVRTSLVVVLLMASACAVPGPDGDGIGRRLTDLAPDESIILFRTAARLDETSGLWHVAIHGWVFELEESVIRKRAIAAVLDQTFALQTDGDAEKVFSSRVDWLFADSESGKVAFVRIGGRDHEMPPSAENGHFRTTVTVSADEVAEIAEDGFLHTSIATTGSTSRIFNGIVSLVPPEGVSVISDIDDTIKVSMVTDRRALLEHALLLEFEPVPGMAQRYSEWERSGVTAHYVSSSPWQMYPALDEFTVRHGFPGASFHLKAIRFRDETLLDLFKDGTQTKPAQIEPILEAWPRRRFVLIGDSGEQDPEIYADLMRRRPVQIRRIYIRNVTGASRHDDRFQTVFAGIEADRWGLFENPAEMQLPDPAEGR